MKLKKYMLEDFLEKIKKLTPIQTSRKNFIHSSFKKKKDYQILKETKLLHLKRKDLSKIQIVEFSIIFIILNYVHLASKKIEEISDISFLYEKNEKLKSILITSLTEGNVIDEIKKELDDEHHRIIKEINENSNIQIIVKNKSDQEILSLIDELIQDHREQSNLRKIESLEQKLINNLDENSYSELIKLKSQINRD